MAEVSFLHFPEEDHDFFIEHDSFLEEISTLDSFPYFNDSLSPRRHATADGGTDNFFAAPTSAAGSRFSEDVAEDRKNQVNFVMDLFHQRVEQSHLVGCDEFVSGVVNDLNFRVIEENYDVGVNSLDLELRLGLGLGLEEEDDDGGDCNCGGFVVSDCGDEFYVARRETGSRIRNDDEIPSSSSRVGGLMVVGIESDSEEEEEEEENELWRIHVHSEEEDFGIDNVNDDDDFGVDNVNDDDLSIPLCWDSFQLEDEDDHGGVNVDFEWEEVDDRVDEREVLSVAADPDDEGSISVRVSGPEEDEVAERGRGLGNLEWEVLLDVNNLGRNAEMIENDNGADPYFGDHDDIFNAAEYELMFGQFAESENAFFSRPPASKAVVEKLPVVITTEEDVLNEKSLCAVCKDEIEVGEEGKQLPCSHRYHGDCILPWLGIRNTCPLCRYELPTDDPDYEQRRVRIAARVA